MECWKAKIPLGHLLACMTQDQKPGSRRGAVHISGKPSKKDKKQIEKTEQFTYRDSQKNRFCPHFSLKGTAKIELPCGRGNHL